MGVHNPLNWVQGSVVSIFGSTHFIVVSGSDDDKEDVNTLFLPR